jgi:hypothetical protein
MPKPMGLYKIKSKIPRIPDPKIVLEFSGYFFTFAAL